jgi:redox-sensitive bicupin YhaK (pirin superfamily)
VHFTLSPGGRVEQPVPAGWNAMAYVLRGRAALAGRDARRGQLVLFSGDGDSVAIAADEEADVLLLAGQPLGEPVARYGPFVMNDPDEVRQAIEDFRAGRMGRIPGLTS